VGEAGGQRRCCAEVSGEQRHGGRCETSQVFVKFPPVGSARASQKGFLERERGGGVVKKPKKRKGSNDILDVELNF
jgi:hypothetical protein